MKKLLLFSALLFSHCALQPAFALTCPNGLIEIKDSAVVNAANGQPYTGSITITQAANSLQGTSTVLGDQQTVTVTAGILDVCVSPGRFSSRQRASSSALTLPGVWIVPSSGGSYRLTDIPTGTVNTSGTAVTSTGEINFAAVAPGDVVTIAGVGYAVATVQGPSALTLVAPGAGVQTGATFKGGPIQQSAATAALVAMYTGAPGATGPQGPSGTGNAPFSRTVAGLSTLTVSAGTHGQGAIVTAYCWNSAGSIACKAVPDAFGNVTFTWPGGFTGGITILGGGSGPQGIQGIPGPAGPMGSLGSFGPTPTAIGVWCPAITVTAGPVQTSGYIDCAPPLAWTLLTNAQWTGMTNAQWTAMTNGPNLTVSWTLLTNSQWTGMTNLQWTGMAN